MPRLVWNTSPENAAEVGLDRAVYYSSSGVAEPWNGLVSVDEVISEDRNKTRYMDGRPISGSKQETSFSATIQAYSYPTELNTKYIKPFGLTYRVKTAKGYKIHLVYNAKAQVSGGEYDQETGEPFDIDIRTRPMAVERAMPTSHLVIDTSETLPEPLSWIETVLYGNDQIAPRLPDPQEIIEFFEEYEPMRVYDLGDGRVMIVGPSNRIEDLGDDQWAIASDETLSYTLNGNGVNSFADDK